MKNRPNIVFILTDDQGPWAMHCAGNDEIETPNLDRIASQWHSFYQFFLCITGLFSCPGIYFDRKNSFTTWNT